MMRVMYRDLEAEVGAARSHNATLKFENDALMAEIAGLNADVVLMESRNELGQQAVVRMPRTPYQVFKPPMPRAPSLFNHSLFNHSLFNHSYI